jgi:hypothetical protein
MSIQHLAVPELRLTIQYEAEDQDNFTVASKFFLGAQLPHGVALAIQQRDSANPNGRVCRSLYPDELRIG